MTERTALTPKLLSDVSEYLDATHYESFADPMKPCQRSALPVGYCGGCYRGEHPRADRRSA